MLGDSGLALEANSVVRGCMSGEGSLGMLSGVKLRHLVRAESIDVGGMPRRLAMQQRCVVLLVPVKRGLPMKSSARTQTADQTSTG